MSHSTEAVALHQLQHEQSKLLDKIDELRTIGVGGLVELPQLIVCGNQSTGKSSVLEAISRVRFPVKAEICTRFTTEVILRRNPSPKIKIFIEPGPSRKDEQQRRNLRNFTHDEFSSGNDLPELLKMAKERMGFAESLDISDDVLKVEISGPDKPELSLVDLPGLYTATSEDQGVQGIRVARELTEKYMKNSRSIILAVISAKNIYHIQTVLDMAKQIDPNRERTLGIITHPDILEENSDEEGSYLQFLKNEKIHLQLGWHALRNRSHKTCNISDDERDEMEKDFFNKGRWASISRESVGIDSLRRRLSSILLKHIRRNLPNLIADIQEKVSDQEQKLSKLGPARSTLQQQKGFLLNIAGNFERVTRLAVNGLYEDEDEFFGGLGDLRIPRDFRRLRAVIRQSNESFADVMTHQGSRQKIIEYGDVVPDKDSVYRSDLEAKVSELARRNRGKELPGTPNPLLVGGLFRDQSKPWEGLAKDHLIKAWESARDFVLLVLQHFTDDHTCSLLLASVIEPELERLKQALLEKLTELTAYTKRGHPLPVGNTFLERIQRLRFERRLQFLSAKLNASNKRDGELEDIAAVEMESSRDEFAAADIVDQMQVYYDMAIVTFIDNVTTLGIENCLLDPLQRIFTSQVINNMEEDHIRELATERSYICEERDRLASELAKLKAGLRTLNIFNTHKPSLGGPPQTAVRGPSPAPFTPSLFTEDSNSKPEKSTSIFESARATRSKSSGSHSALDSTNPTSSVPTGLFAVGGFGRFSSEQAPLPGSFGTSGASTSSGPATDSGNGFLSTPKPQSAPSGVSSADRDTSRAGFGAGTINDSFDPSMPPSTKGWRG